MSEKSARPRNPRIEALRLVAILGIAVFHTFQPWFDAATSGTWAPSAATLSVLGCVNLLGSYGNFVFFLISGLFLIPRTVENARANIPWKRRWSQVLRRALPILATVAIYATCALLVSSFVTPIEGVSLGKTGWLAGGLQFIWVYLALVVASPVMGQVWVRVRKPQLLVSALVAAVFVVNAYIAFVSPGEDVRGLLEWRKLMSAVSYLAAFLAGGALAGSEHPRLVRALMPVAIVAVTLEVAAAAMGSLWLLKGLSFKSTSLPSFLLAVSSLCRAAERPDTNGEPPLARAARALARSVLGFYVAQSMFFSLWQPLVTSICSDALAVGEASLLCTGVLLSVALLAVSFAFDQLVRLPLLRLARIV